MKYTKFKHSLYILLLFAFLFIPSQTIHAATYFNVTTFGANGTDTQADTAAIQEALDQAALYDSIVVKIPNGTYYIDKTLYIQSNTQLQLSSKAIIKRTDSAQGKNMLRNTDASHKSNKIGKYDLSTNIMISGGTWDGGNISKAKKSKTSNLIYLGHASNITIQNTTIKNCFGAHAIELAGVKDSIIRNCKITGFRYDSSMFTSEAIQVDTCYKSKDDGAWTPGFKLDKTESRNILIEKNKITDYPRGIGIHHKLKGHITTNITIRNNTFQRSSASTQGKSVVGIFLLGVDKATISGNKFNYYYYGAMVKNSTKITIKKNNFKYNTLGSLSISANDKNNGTHAFVVTSAKAKKKTLKFSCGMIKSGTVKIHGKTYHFSSKEGKVSLKLKKKMKENEKVTFYGKDKYNNKYYKTYYIPKLPKKE